MVFPFRSSLFFLTYQFANSQIRDNKNRDPPVLPLSMRTEWVFVSVAAVFGRQNIHCNSGGRIPKQVTRQSSPFKGD